MCFALLTCIQVYLLYCHQKGLMLKSCTQRHLYQVDSILYVFFPQLSSSFVLCFFHFNFIKEIYTRICYFNWAALQRMSRSTILVFRHIGLITSCPMWVLVFYEQIGNYNKFFSAKVVFFPLCMIYFLYGKNQTY